MALLKWITVVLTLQKRPENASAAKTFRHIYLGHFFLQIVKLPRGVSFVVTVRQKNFSLLQNFICTMFSRAGKMNFLSGQDEFRRGQDDFFQTANQPISVRHLSLPYNKFIYSSHSANESLIFMFFPSNFFLKSILITIDLERNYSRAESEYMNTLPSPQLTFQRRP